MRAPFSFLAFSILLFAIPASAQTAPQPNAATPSASDPLPVAYDVISVKPHRQDDSRVGSYWRTNSSGFSADVSVRSLITSAYHVIMPEQIVGLPAWAQTEDFDIQAKLDPENAETVTKLHGDDLLRENALLMQALLADRFKLKAHLEQKELPVYNLVVSKGGSRIKQAAASQNTGYRMGMGTISSKAMPIASLCASLSHPTGRLIIDKTGLTGNYEVDLAWNWNDDPNSTTPSLFSALQDQLGLKLEPAKVPLDVVVIDRIERPSEN